MTNPATTLTEERVDEVRLGIAPVPHPLRRLSGLDVGVLWGDLAVGILVLAAGALLVTPASSGGLGLRFGNALLAILIGSVAGSLLLALVAVAGHDRGVPSMVLLRPVLGRYGSYGASLINLAQLIGWTGFEFWAMALFANRVSKQVFDLDAFGLWLAVVAIFCTGLALAGPLRVVRVWLERFGLWIVLAACGYLTLYYLFKGGFGPFIGTTRGSAPFAVAVDLVVVMPVSWLPLVADYNRFSVGRRQNFTGTFGGYSLGNAWFYALGALLVLAGGFADSSPEGIAAGILGISAGVVVGTVLLLSLLAGETDEAFADIYSAAVSTQNIVPRMSQRGLVIAIAAAGTAIASVVTASDYETFLFLLGSVFVPLFGVVLAAWIAGRLAGPADTDTSWFRPATVVVWVAGFALYHWINPVGPSWWIKWFTDRVPGTGDYSWLGSSLPSFAFAFTAGLVVEWLTRRRSRDGAAVRST
jgi:putative hydroxymethylpyrimidine transporter CytX